MRLTRIIREAAVEAFFVAQAKLRGWIAAKWVSPSWNGVPDRIVFKSTDEAAKRIMALTGGRLTMAACEQIARDNLASCIEFVELKSPGKQPTILQMRRHEQLRKLGFKVSVIDSPEAVEQWYADRS